MRVTITGADGMLGRALTARLAEHEPVGLVEPAFSLEDREGVIRAIAASTPDWVIHTAAMTNVDGCELDPQKAYRINALGTRHVAEACTACGAGLLYVSTDFVFGRQTMRRPIEAWEPGGPLSVYGMSKWGGERYVEAMAPRFMIARTAWLYGERGTHFVGTILRRAREGATLRVVNDQTGNPTYARDVADGVYQLIRRNAPGWYHLVNTGETTWFGFARAILELAGLDPDQVQPCSSLEYKRPAPRPEYSSLSTLTYREITGSDFRPWREAVEDFLLRATDHAEVPGDPGRPPPPGS